MARPIQRIAPLLFCSGACALLYQIVWLRELRLIFGASTSASAAVLAMFMGGLGAGGLVLGKRADARKDPLMLYANLELGVAALAALTPFLVDGSRLLYSALGGTVTMGMGLGTVVRLLLSAVVLVPVTFLMGGTLPAAAKAAETDDDLGRKHLALLYGVNTLGAVMGALFTTFMLLEVFGGRLLLWMCCLLNALLAVIARGIARGLAPEPPAVAMKRRQKAVAEEDEAAGEEAPDSADEAAASAEAEPAAAAKEALASEAQAPASGAQPAVPALFVLAAAAVVGLTFLLMELVFYRMLGPILGGSSYTFGLILVFALLGVGLGGAAYARYAGNRAATLRAFALTCLLEALCFLIPFALGDRVALLALSLRSLKALGFYPLVAGWAVVTAVVVLPAAFISGVQFPLLMALLGRGRKDVGRHVGLAYAWNTVGSIVGSLAGGFGLIPWLSAPGVWRLSALLLLALGIVAALLSLRAEKKQPERLVLHAAAVAACVLLVRAGGPTAAFRHSPIGTGRADYVIRGATTNSLQEWINLKRRSLVWEQDGVESSVALSKEGGGYGFVVNGRVDGHTRVDAGTQVMGGLIGAFLHPEPKRALVVGLGTGSTAGWLGAVPTMQSVDVAELEPAILRVARDCAPVNENVLDNPKVHVHIGDAREVLLTTKDKYDIIFSEPSNPYRAGIASLFTKEFYEASASRLEKGGIFLQWLQGYDVDGQTVWTVYATIASVFPHVETWLSNAGDFILVASAEPIGYDAAALRQRLTQEPFRSAAANTWRVSDLEGFLGHYVASDGLSRAILEHERGQVSTDDRNLLEFSFARTIGRDTSFDARQVFEVAINRGEDRPAVQGKVDWEWVDEQRMAMFVIDRQKPLALERYNLLQLRWLDAWTRQGDGDFSRWREVFESEKKKPRTVTELEVVAEGYADLGNEAALPAVEALRGPEPVEASAILARYHLRKGDLKDAGDAALAAIEGYREDPWPELPVMSRFMSVVIEIGSQDKAQGARLFEALKQPFAVRLLEENRLFARIRLARRVDFEKLCVEAYADFEPYVPFDRGFLQRRLECYALNDDPRKAAAERDLAQFIDDAATSFRTGLEEHPPPPEDL